jgi:hypothetical protein
VQAQQIPLRLYAEGQAERELLLLHMSWMQNAIAPHEVRSTALLTPHSIPLPSLFF